MKRRNEPPRASFDTTVLAKALRHRAGVREVKDDTAENERCWHAVAAQTAVIVCPIAWLELARFARAAEQAALDELERRVRFEPVDDDVTRIALRLMRERVQQISKEACPKCGNVKASVACSGCGRAVSERTRFNDYIIVAHAESLGLDFLYTTDNGMLAMGRSVVVDVRLPPGDGPLFDPPSPAPADSEATGRPRRG